MTRTWGANDPEPTDHPTVIDSAGDVWHWDVDEGGEPDGGWWSCTVETMNATSLWPWYEVLEPGSAREWLRGQAPCDCGGAG